MPLFGEVKRTYSKKQVPISVFGNFNLLVPTTKQNNDSESGQSQMFGSDNKTLDSSYWKDSFDKLKDSSNK